MHRRLITVLLATHLAFLAHGACAVTLCKVRAAEEDPTAAIAVARAVLRDRPSLQATRLVDLDVGDEIRLLGSEGCQTTAPWLRIDSRRCVDRKRINGTCETYKGWIQRHELSLGPFARVNTWRSSRIDVSIGDYGYTLEIGAVAGVTYKATLPRKCRPHEQPVELGLCMTPVKYEGGHLYRYQDLFLVEGSQTYIEPLFLSTSGALCSTYCKACCESGH